MEGTSLAIDIDLLNSKSIYILGEKVQYYNTNHDDNTFQHTLRRRDIRQ